MDKGKSAEEIWKETVVHVANRDGLAEQDSNETLESGQPGGAIRRLLRYLRESRFGRSLEDPPITHITNEREGD